MRSRLLQACTLILFTSLLAGFVVYQSSCNKNVKAVDNNQKKAVKRNNVALPSSKSMPLTRPQQTSQQAEIDTIETLEIQRKLMYSSKSGPMIDLNIKENGQNNKNAKTDSTDVKKDSLKND